MVIGGAHHEIISQISHMDQTLHRIELTISKRGIINAFRVINLTCAILLFQAADCFFRSSTIFDGHIFILLGACLIIADILHQTPFRKRSEFIVTFSGRGLFYLLAGLKVAIHSPAYHPYGSEVIGIILIIVGVLYIIFDYTSGSFGYPDSPDWSGFLAMFQQLESNPRSTESQRLMNEQPSPANTIVNNSSPEQVV